MNKVLVGRVEGGMGYEGSDLSMAGISPLFGKYRYIYYVGRMDNRVQRFGQFLRKLGIRILD